MPDATTNIAPAEAPAPQKKPLPKDSERHLSVAEKIGTDPEGFPVGIAGEKLEHMERKVGADEPPAWPVNEKLSVVGKPTPRIDGRLKVTGAAKYTADVKLPGMLFARMITSPHPHAVIKSIDTSAAEKASGVKAVHMLANPRERMRFVGQSIGAIAAVSMSAAEAAARLVKISYEELPFVTDMEKAKQPDAPEIFK